MHRKRGNTENTQKDSAMTEFIKIRALANINPDGGVVFFFKNFLKSWVRIKRSSLSFCDLK